MKKYVLLLLIYYNFQLVSAQCKIKISGSLCLNQAITFKGNTLGTAHTWNMNGVGTSLNQVNSVFSFNSSGFKKIIYTTTINGVTCKDSITIFINPLPIIKNRFFNRNTDPCIQSTEYCIKDSSATQTGVKIAWSQLLVDDGQLFTKTKPANPNQFCFKYVGTSLSKIKLYFELSDDSGCINKDSFFISKYAKTGSYAKYFKPKFIENCDSLIFEIEDTSSSLQSSLVKVKYNWGNGKVDSNYTKYKKYIYKKDAPKTILVTHTNALGCTKIDTFKRTNSIRIPNPKIIGPDSMCSETTAKFKLDSNYLNLTKTWTYYPQGSIKVTSNGDNFFLYSQGLGPQLLNLTISNGICSNNFWDTILVIGPIVRIEIEGNRLDESQVYQCNKIGMHQVDFNNLTTYYHNDSFMPNDNKLVFDSAKKKFVPYFNSNYYALLNNKNLRTYGDCINRVWDFGDDYAQKCTTNIKKNINVKSNCRYTNQFIPTHFYKNWDDIKWQHFGNESMQESYFDNALGTCYSIPVYPSDSLYDLIDSVLVIPSNSTASQIAAFGTVYSKNLPISKLITPGVFTFNQGFVLNLEPGQTIEYAKDGKVFITITGPKKLVAIEKSIIKKTTKDSFNFVLGKVPIDITLYKNIYNNLKPTHPDFKIENKYPIPVNINLKYKVDENLWNKIFQAENVECYNVTLTEQDTCTKDKCIQIANKSIVISDPIAKDYLIRPLINSDICKSSLNGRNFGIDVRSFKPNCGSPFIYINPDSAANPNNWIPFKGPFNNIEYLKNGNFENDNEYGYNFPKYNYGLKTIGFIVGNGVSPSPFDRPICYDTVWYPNLIDFNVVKTKFNFYNLKGKPTKFGMGCKGDSVFFNYSQNSTYLAEQFHKENYTFKSPNTNKFKDLYYEHEYDVRIIKDSIFTNPSNYLKKSAILLNDKQYTNPKFRDSILLILKDKSLKKYCTIAIATTKIQAQSYKACNSPGLLKTTTVSDTVLLGFSLQSSYSFDFTHYKDALFKEAYALGFDPFGMTKDSLLKLIWNQKGIFGKPLTSAYGCIDFSKFSKYFVTNREAGKYVSLHPRDTSVVGLEVIKIDSTLISPGNYKNNYFYTNKVKLPYNGGYISEATIGYDDCNKVLVSSIFNGFSHIIKFPDTVFCASNLNEFSFTPEISYFDSTSLPWKLASNSQWYNTQRQAEFTNGDKNREMPPIWDWDYKDNTTNTATYNGTFPFGGRGQILNENDFIPISRFGTPPTYYYGDTQVFKFSSITKDSLGCADTFSQNIYLVKPTANFSTSFDVTNCQSLISIKDSSYTILPNAIKNNRCKNAYKLIIETWIVDWGDSTQLQTFEKKNGGFPKNVGHLYAFGGKKTISLTIITNKGCESTISKKVEIPRPKPSFKFKETDSNFISICVGETARMINTTTKFTKSGLWKWDFGDGVFSNSADTQVNHVYAKPGRYLVTLTQFDSIFIPPNIKAFCQGIFPLDSTILKMIVFVKPLEQISGLVKYPIICPNQEQEFIDISSFAYTEYTWNINEDIFNTKNKNIKKAYSKPGLYTVIHSAIINPTWPLPHCLGKPDTLIFLVDSVKANFSIDTNGTPKICFKEKTINGTTFNWSFKNLQNPLPNGSFKIDETTNNKEICEVYKQGGEYWVCLVAENLNGCKDTVCKKIEINVFLFLSNVFTPGNNDGLNDTYKIPVKGIQNYNLNIYNRWNERVFKSTDANITWNGKVFNTGTECTDGTYFYIFTFNYANDKTQVINGSINLIRNK